MLYKRELYKGNQYYYTYIYALVRALSIQVQIIKSWYYVLLHQYHALHMSYGMGSNEIPHLQVVLSYQVWIELKIPQVESSSSLTFFEVFQSSRVDLKIPQVELSLTFFEVFFRDKLTRKIYPPAPKLYPPPHPWAKSYNLYLSAQQ